MAKTTAKETAMKNMQQRYRKVGRIPEGTRRFTTNLDTALPGKHTKALHDNLSSGEASILAQLRTGKSALNGFLYRIGHAETAQCECGHQKETVEHFLFRCIQWKSQRKRLLQQTESRRGCLSYFLGGKAASESEPWTPNMATVRATIKFASDTGRLTATIKPAD